MIDVLLVLFISSILIYVIILFNTNGSFKFKNNNYDSYYEFEKIRNKILKIKNKLIKNDLLFDTRYKKLIDLEKKINNIK